MRRVFLAYLPAALWAGVVLYLGGHHDPPVPRFPIPMADKVLHFGAYGVLGALAGLGRFLAGWRPARAWPLVLGLVLLGGLDELRQTTIPTRHAAVGDWVADALGVAVAFGLVTWWCTRRVGERRHES